MPLHARTLRNEPTPFTMRVQNFDSYRSTSPYPWAQTERIAASMAAARWCGLRIARAMIKRDFEVEKDRATNGFEFFVGLRSNLKFTCSPCLLSVSGASRRKEVLDLPNLTCVAENVCCVADEFER